MNIIYKQKAGFQNSTETFPWELMQFQATFQDTFEITYFGLMFATSNTHAYQISLPIIRNLHTSCLRWFFVIIGEDVQIEIEYKYKRMYACITNLCNESLSH